MIEMLVTGVVLAMALKRRARAVGSNKQCMAGSGHAHHKEQFMADRAVRKTGKNKDGDITRLCNDGDWWSPRSKADAIADIESGAHTYYVPWTSGRTEIRVVNDSVKGKYLRTDRDNTTRNNLDDLPDC